MFSGGDESVVGIKEVKADRCKIGPNTGSQKTPLAASATCGREPLMLEANVD